MTEIVRQADKPIDVLMVGCGNMGYALLAGWLPGERMVKAHIVEPVVALRERAEAIGATASVDISGLPPGFDPAAIVFAVKPQHLCDLLPAYLRFAQDGAFFLSVAAGIEIAAMADVVGTDVPIVRCMPNMAAAVGAGMLVCCANLMTSKQQRHLAERLLSPAGKVVFIDDEALMHTVTAVSGSGPAYVFHFLECLERAGTAGGLPDALARDLVLQTIYGAGLLARKSSDDPAVLRRQVTSPNGTTAAALAVLMGEGGLDTLLARTVEAARVRSVELGAH
ncbi:pyrroline-5-carboxylate reductase [Mesorhizobium sp. NZP2234]|uniref:pyrroline-5-carboxylate reductase n=1 Tax=Mesorhizobium sp. NZP2234 TaxID=2483402 RepID=UPI0032B186F8